MRFLVTGGPTHEYLDDVRFLGNPSTGRMGVAVAEAARDRGHPATLILGPSQLPDPPGVRVRRVTSALEMRDALLAELPAADALVMTAAVADYRPRDRVQGKIKKGREDLLLPLVKNPDILQEACRMAGDRILVGFALEAASPDEALANAREKLVRKRCDLIVLNRTGSLGGGRGEDVVLVFRGGSCQPLGAPDKRSLAERLVLWCEEASRERGNAGIHGDDTGTPVLDLPEG